MNRLLLDTCTFIWLVSQPKQLSKAAIQAIDNTAHEIIFSDVSALEISLKFPREKIMLPLPPREWIEEQLAIWKPAELPLNRQTIYRASELPNHHTDPFDRLLIAAALVNHLTIVTPDPEIRRYPVPTIW